MLTITAGHARNFEGARVRTIPCSSRGCDWTATVDGSPSMSKRRATSALLEHADSCEFVARDRAIQADMAGKWQSRQQD